MTSVYSTEYQLVIKTLRDSRIEKGITQAKLAEALGRPQSFIAASASWMWWSLLLLPGCLGWMLERLLSGLAGDFILCDRTYDLRITNALISTYPGAMSKLGTP